VRWKLWGVLIVIVGGRLMTEERKATVEIMLHGGGSVVMIGLNSRKSGENFKI
jgi:hypothetical protein